MPLILLLLAAGAAFYVWRKRPLLPASEAAADALVLLNFPPFTLQPGRSTTLLYLAPAGLDVTRARSAIMRTTDVPVGNMTVIRTGVPIPSPTTGAIPAYADLWQVESSGGNQLATITPSFVLQRILTRRGLPTVTVNVQPAQQLAGLLYANTLATNAGREQPEFIPVAGRQ